jgi:hypothetical protein
MAQTRGTFDALYDNVDKTVAGIMKAQLDELPRIYPSIYNIKTSDRKFERVVTYVPFSQTATKPEGQPYAFENIRQGFTKDFTHTENGLGFEVTQTALEDDPENLLTKAGQWLAFSARYLEEQRAANPFNNGFGSETTPDGVSLFNTAHLLAGGGTARNTLATAADLSATSLTTALIDLQTQTVDEAGHLAAPLKSIILYVPPALEFLAHRLVKSELMPGSADNDLNTIRTQRTWRVVVNPHLSDSDAWFLVSGTKSMHALTFYRRTPITLEPMDKDARTGNRIWKVRHRFSVGAWAWQNTYGSPGA